MVEFAVAVVSLALLGTGAIMIARYHSIQLQTIVAARNAAFEHSWLGDRRTPADIDRRSQGLSFTNAGWRDPTGGQALLDSRASVRVTATEGGAPESAATITNFLLQPLRVVSGFLGAGFDLSAQGFERSHVVVDVMPVRHLPRPFDQLQLQFDEHFALLGDAWNAGDPQHVARRVAGLVPTNLLSRQASLLAPLAAPIRLLEPAIARLCLGLIEPEMVPADRLGPPGRRSLQIPSGGCR